MNNVPVVPRVEVNIHEIDKFESEDDFIGLSVDLLIEAGGYVCAAASIMPGEGEKWNSDQAVIGGNFVRLYKLISALLDQTCQRRREISFMLARMAFECIVNLRYIIKNLSPELLFSYKAYSLKHEKKLLEKIRENIQRRNGDELPIEKRMIESIFRSFRESDISPEEIKPKELRNWGDKNIYERADDVGLSEAYLAAFGGPSHGIHGNWQDLLEYHLISEGDGLFSPNLDWRRPRPQYLNVVSLHSAEVVEGFVRELGFEEIQGLIKNLNDLQERILILDKAHEKWLAGNA
tara:strand:+ start:25601 stop:26476 length:876 start_codon:yes stop_codon:yes gene_type:complete